MLLALVMLLSTVSALTLAVPYKDGAIKNYDDLGNPVFTTAQYASMILDSMDASLAAADMEKMDIPIVNVTVDLTSVDGILATFDQLRNYLASPVTGMLAKAFVGDIADFKFAATRDNRRGKTDDLLILKNFIQLLQDNWALIQKLLSGQASFGMMNLMKDQLNEILSVLDFEYFAKAILYMFSNPNASSSDINNKKKIKEQNADEMIQGMIVFILDLMGEVGLSDVFGGKSISELFGNSLNMNDPAITSTYGFVENMVENLYNDGLVFLANNQLKMLLREACGVGGYTQDPNIDIPNSVLKDGLYTDIIDVNYEVPKVNKSAPYDGQKNIITALNYNLGKLIEAILVGFPKTGPDAWDYAGGNAKIVDNFVKAMKFAWIKTEGSILTGWECVRAYRPEQINAMTNQEFISYILRSFININLTGSTEDHFIPDEADTLAKVLWHLFQQDANQRLPDQDYSDPILYSQDAKGVMNIVADLLAYSMNQSSDLNPAYAPENSPPQEGRGLLEYGKGFDATLTTLMKWMQVNVFGLFNISTIQPKDPPITDGWAALDTFLFKFINKNWLPEGTGTLKEVVYNDILQNLCELKFKEIFDLIDRDSPKLANSDLQKPLKHNIFIVMQKLLNSMFPNAVSEKTEDKKDYLSLQNNMFDALLQNENLLPMVGRIVGQINVRKEVLLDTLLPVLANLMGLTNPQELGDLIVYLPERIPGATDFKLYNSSSGVNTGYTNKDGTFTQDKLYLYTITDFRIYTNGADGVRTQRTDMTLTGITRGTTAINGGDTLAVKLAGVGTGTNAPLPEALRDNNITIEIDYKITDETGKSITQNALTETVYTYYAANNVNDDDKVLTKHAATTTTNAHELHVPQAFFLGQNESTSKFLDFTLMVKRNKGSAGVFGVGASDPLESKVGINTVTMTDSEAAKWVQFRTGEIATQDADMTFYISPFSAKTGVNRGQVTNNIRFELDYSVTADKTRSAGQATTWTGKVPVFAYDDRGLPSTYRNELAQKRQKEDYTNTAAWDAYTKAMAKAAYLVLRPKRANNFLTSIIPAYQPAQTELDAAIKGLAGNEKATPDIAVVRTKLATYSTANAANLSYDSAGYKFDSISDYVPNTYLNWKAAEARAQEISANYSPTRYSAAVVANTINRLDLMHSRLIRVDSSNGRLVEALSLYKPRYTKDSYTADSWAAYEKAYTFAIATINGFEANKTEATRVLFAQSELLARWKQLTLKEKDTGILADKTYNLVFQYRNASDVKISKIVVLAEGAAITSTTAPTATDTSNRIFGGWKDLPGTMPNKDLVIEAIYTPIRAVSAIAVKTKPLAGYLKGEAFNGSAGEITVTYSDGSTATIKLTGDSRVGVTGFNANTCGLQDILVTFMEDGVTKTVTFQVTVYGKGKVTNNGAGDINARDVLALQRHILKIEKLNADQVRAGKVTGEGDINARDVLALQRHILKIETIK